MKKIHLQLAKLALAGICIAITAGAAHAQSMGLTGIGTITPDSSAALDVKSDTLGFLPPRMTTTQRNAIKGPAKGLLIYNTTLGIVEINIGTAVAPIWTTANGGIQTVRTQTATLTGAGPSATVSDNTGLITLANSSPAPTGAVTVTAPANATTGQLLTVNNNTGLTATYAGVAIPAGGGRQFVFNGTSWVPVNNTATTVTTASATQAVSGANPNQQLPSGSEYVNVTGSPTGTVTLTPPASVVAGQVITITNNTSVPASFTGTTPATTLPVGATQQYVYTGTTWMPVGSAGPVAVNSSNQTASGANPTTTAPASGTTYINVTGSPSGTVTVTPPTAPVAGQVVNVTNGTGVPATYAGNTIAAGGGGSYIYNGTTWVPTTGPNFYNNDGALGGNRTVTTGANNLAFIGSTGGTYVRMDGADKRSFQVTNSGVSTSIFGTDGNTAVLGADIGPVDIRTGMSNTTLGGTSRIFAGTNGNVGIGTNAPAQKLDVRGNIYVANPAATGTAPTNIEFDGSTSSTAGQNAKLSLWGGTGGTAPYGFGVSSGSLDYMVPGTASHNWYANGVKTMGLDAGGNLLAQGWMQGTVFYDKDNYGYYCDPAGGIALNGAGEVRGNLFRDNNNGNYYLNPDDGGNSLVMAGRAIGAGITGSGESYGSAWRSAPGNPYYLNPSDAGTSLYGAGEIQGRLFRDKDNNNFYVDADWISHMNRLDFSNGYDVDDNNYYMDLNNGSRFKDLQINGTLLGASAGCCSGLNIASPGGPTLNIATTYGNSGGGVGANANGNVYYDVYGSTESHIFGGNVVPDLDGSRSSGFSDHRWSAVYAVNGTIQTSDMRMKKNFAPLQYGLKEVLAIKPFTFDWKDNTNKLKKVGFSAQELQKLMPELVNVGDDTAHTLGVNYGELTPVLIKAVQEQQAEIEALKTRNAALTATTTQLQAQNAKLTAATAELAELKTTMAALRKAQEDVRAELSSVVVNKVAKGKVAAK